MSITIYLLHFDAEVRKCRHYIGSCETVRFQRRMQEHRNGYGANLTKQTLKSGVAWKVSRLWSSTSRDYEFRLKNNGHYRRLCPLCNHRLNLELPLQPGPTTSRPLDKSDFQGVGF